MRGGWGSNSNVSEVTSSHCLYCLLGPTCVCECGYVRMYHCVIVCVCVCVCWSVCVSYVFVSRLSCVSASCVCCLCGVVVCLIEHNFFWHVCCVMCVRVCNCVLCWLMYLMCAHLSCKCAVLFVVYFVLCVVCCVLWVVGCGLWAVCCVLCGV